MFSKLNWQSVAGAALLILTLALLARADYTHLLWAENLNAEGSPAPKLDASSPTGYQDEQRHFLGTVRRGETYRWIAYTQELAANGFFQATHYEQDTAPTGRPQLLPKLYAGWLMLIAALVPLFGGAPSFPIALETAALWEPLISHLAIFVILSVIIAKRFGLPQAAIAGLLFALFPYFSAQFIPGALSPDTWAMFLAGFAVLLAFPNRGENIHPIRYRTALLAALSLWLNPAFGFPAVLLLALSGVLYGHLHRKPLPYLKWALLGAAVSIFGSLIDQNPWDPAASELRYLHPLYAFAWLGLGLILTGYQKWRLENGKALRFAAQIVAGALLCGFLAKVHISEGYMGWLYSGASLLRPASLDASQVFSSVFQWMSATSLAENFFFLLLPALGLGAIIFNLSKSDGLPREDAWISLLLIVGIGVLSVLKIRWGIVLSLIAIPVLWNLVTTLRSDWQRYSLVAFAPLLFAFLAWGKSLPTSLKRPVGEDLLSSSDLEALVYRHNAHWMATHYPTREVNALASPELSDSLIFHGNCKTLLSTAWESYPGQVAASRVLSAPESSEVQAVLESREVTHVLLPSWDKVLPLLIQTPQDSEDSTFYDRIQRWLLPLFIRPAPYHLPPIPGFEVEKLVIFEMVPPQDDALSLSRLAEYFVEMRRQEPAQLAAESLAEAYPEDPNAQIAQAFVYTNSKDALGFRTQVRELTADVQAGLVPLDWDRRVLRAIILALGKQHGLAKPETQACLETMNEEGIYALTPLQAFQFLRLVATYEMQFPEDSMRLLILDRCSEYLPKK